MRWDWIPLKMGSNFRFFATKNDKMLQGSIVSIAFALKNKSDEKTCSVFWQDSNVYMVNHTTHHALKLYPGLPI